MDNKNRSANHHTVLSRRDALRAGTAAIAATGLAGCSALPGGGSGAPDGFDYTQYLHAPEEVEDYEGVEDYGSNVDESRFIYGKPLKIKNNEEYFDEEIYEGTDSEYSTAIEDHFDGVQESLDIDFDEITNALRTGGGLTRVLTVESEVDIINRIENNGFDEIDESESISDEYKLYSKGPTGSNSPTAVSVKDDVIIYANNGNGIPIEIPIDTKNGETDMYTNAYESSEVLFNNIGYGDVVRGWAIEEPDEEERFAGLDNVVGYGAEQTYNGEKSEVKAVYVHENQDDIDTEDAREYFEEEGFFNDANEYNVSQNGKAIIANADYDTDELNYIL